MKIVIAKSELVAQESFEGVLSEVLGGFGYVAKTKWELVKSAGVLFKSEVVNVRISITGNLVIDVREEAVCDWISLYGKYIIAVKNPLQSMMLAMKQLVETGIQFGTNTQPEVSRLVDKYTPTARASKIGEYMVAGGDKIEAIGGDIKRTDLYVLAGDNNIDYLDLRDAFDKAYQEATPSWN